MLCVIPFVGFSQGDHLEPAEDYFNLYPHHRDYYPFLQKHLLASLSSRPVMRVLVMPSFSPESVVSVERDSSKNYIVVLRRAKENIWYSKKKEAVQTEQLKNSIGIVLAKKVESVFGKVSTKVKYREEISLGSDGTTYLFSGFVPGFGWRSGKTWSPEKGTRMESLVEIGHLLIELAEEKSSDKRKSLEDQVMIKLNALESIL
jgi:hypothetical protein